MEIQETLMVEDIEKYRTLGGLIISPAKLHIGTNDKAYLWPICNF